MQTILGAGGAIGSDLARVLASHHKKVRIVGRSPKAVNPGDELVVADLLDAQQVDRAVQGSDVCYLTVGLQYAAKVWEVQWPVLMKNVIDACERHGARLVFFSNVYTVGGDNVRHITESSPVSPTSRKGEIRAGVERMVLDAAEKGRIRALIARAPDFFGPVKHTSALMILVYDNLAKGKKAQWFCNADVVHTMGYTPDLAQGTALLGMADDTYGQIWNLPVPPENLTGRQWVSLFGELLKVTPGLTVVPSLAVKALGLFMPVLRESAEMLYQYDRDYVVDSSRFNTHFGFAAKTNREALRETLKVLGHEV
jgi:nucleoside-diphosphate-sugar epimerase